MKTTTTIDTTTLNTGINTLYVHESRTYNTLKTFLEFWFNIKFDKVNTLKVGYPDDKFQKYEECFLTLGTHQIRDRIRFIYGKKIKF